MTEDIKYMKLALQLAKKGKGFTEPNPMVGAVAVKDGRILATGYHTRFGNAHAEQMALQNSIEPGATLYVTLEPCSHFGKTPPCSELIIKRNIKRVVIPSEDPNPFVNGKGITRLRSQGIQVDVGVLKDMADKLNRHYFKYITHQIPYVTLRAGVSIDGKLTDNSSDSRWITSEEMRNYSHSLRGEYSAILAGVNTILKDDPMLTIRDKFWNNKSLTRVILDTNNQLINQELKIFKNRDQFPVVIFSSINCMNLGKNPNADYHYFIKTEPNHSGLNIQEVLQKLYEIGISSVLVEGGGATINSFLVSGNYDEILLFSSYSLIGGKDSVQLHVTGSSVKTPIRFENPEIFSFKSGYIFQAYKNLGDDCKRE